MCEKSVIDLAAIDLSECAEFLVAYGRTMQRVQEAEKTLKSILLCLNMDRIAGESEGPIDDETFERILQDPQKKAMSRVLKDLAAKFPFLSKTLFTQERQEYINWLVRVRNRLAHKYLAVMAANWEMIDDPGQRQLLIAELNDYARAFEAVGNDWRKMLNVLMKHVGLADQENRHEEKRQWQRQYLKNLQEEFDARGKPICLATKDIEETTLSLISERRDGRGDAC